jgi:hypothetical protein
MLSRFREQVGLAAQTGSRLLRSRLRRSKRGPALRYTKLCVANLRPRLLRARLRRFDRHDGHVKAHLRGVVNRSGDDALFDQVGVTQ